MSKMITQLYRTSVINKQYMRLINEKKPQTIEQKLLAREKRLKSQKNYYTVERAELFGFRSNFINKSFMKKALSFVNNVLNTNRLTKEIKEEERINYGKFKQDEYQYFEYFKYLKHLEDPKVNQQYLKKVRDEFETLPYKLQTDMKSNMYKQEEYPIKMHPTRIHIEQKAYVMPKSQFYKHLLNTRLDDIQEARILND